MLVTRAATWLDEIDGGGVFTLPAVELDAFIFDCDGTLADTMPLHFEAWRWALSSHGARFEFEWNLFLSRAGMSLEATVLELNAQFGETLLPDAVAAAQRDYFRRHRRQVAPVSEVVAFARRVGAELPVSVASGSLREEVRHTLRAIDAEALFPIVITPEDVRQGKPAPDMFLLAAERMGVKPEHCGVFEDAELGLEAARRAGMHPIRVVPRSLRAL